MSEQSAWFDGDTYNANVFDNSFADFLTPGVTASAGVIKGVGGNLACTGATSPIAVAAGAAFVNGKYYANSASINVNVATPATNPRIDRIILRCTYASKTITAVLLAGTEAVTPSAPALTQTDGTTWEISLAQVLITTGGVTTVTNERVWCKPRGVWNKGDIKAVGSAVTFVGHFPVDPDLGTVDADWHLCNGDTVNGVVTDDLRDKFLLCAGTTYARAATGGAATKDVSHVHAAGSIVAANESTHVHAAGSIVAANESTHIHAISITTAAGGGHYHTMPGGSAIGGGSGYGSETDAVSTHAHALNGNSAAGAAHTHAMSGNSGAGGAHTHAMSGNSASGGSATQDIMPPYFSLAYVAYVGV